MEFFPTGGHRWSTPGHHKMSHGHRWGCDGKCSGHRWVALVCQHGCVFDVHPDVMGKLTSRTSRSTTKDGEQSDIIKDLTRKEHGDLLVDWCFPKDELLTHFGFLLFLIDFTRFTASPATVRRTFMFTETFKILPN